MNWRNMIIYLCWFFPLFYNSPVDSVVFFLSHYSLEVSTNIDWGRRKQNKITLLMNSLVLVVSIAGIIIQYRNRTSTLKLMKKKFLE